MEILAETLDFDATAAKRTNLGFLSGAQDGKPPKSEFLSQMCLLRMPPLIEAGPAIRGGIVKWISPDIYIYIYIYI